MATYSIEVVATTTSAGGAAYKIVIDSTDCVSGRTLVQNRAVAPSNTLDWGFYGNVISIPKGQLLTLVRQRVYCCVYRDSTAHDAGGLYHVLDCVRVCV